jgi:hypothetical protein
MPYFEDNITLVEEDIINVFLSFFRAIATVFLNQFLRDSP